MSFNRTKFDAFIGSLNLDYFNASEFLVGTGRSKNSPPPERIWPNIVPTALVIDAFRGHVGKSITITSCYRAPAYNWRKWVGWKSGTSKPGQAKLSQHQAFSAIDFKVSGMSPDSVVAKLRAWEGGEWFRSPIQFNRVSVNLSSEAKQHGISLPKGNVIPFSPLPQKYNLGFLGSMFTFKGGIDSYTSFSHFDTRGQSSRWL
ncbi:MAG: D-Ala-D-Ala carboxypeptidase family metallohydrolase [Planctomycetales bacterium]